VKKLKSNKLSSLSRNQLMNINGGRIGGGESGYQCCNAWGCGTCVTGSSRDCSSYGEEVWGQDCTVSGSATITRNIQSRAYY